jgi:hypothetical protein
MVVAKRRWMMGRVPKAAVFVDVENQACFSPRALLQLLAHLDTVERHAFADWRNHRLARIGQQLDGCDFQLHHTPSGETLGMEKDKADEYMDRAARALLERRRDIEVVVLVSGDHYFVDLIHELHDRGVRVIVAASPMSVSKELCSVAYHYLPLGEVASWIKALDDLERFDSILTFRAVLQKSSLSLQALQWLMKAGLVDERPHQTVNGSIQGIGLNRHAHPVRVVLGGLIA